MNGIFLTGGTGNVGSSILEQLLNDGNCRIYLLLRAKSEADAEQRKLSLLHVVMGGRGADYENRVTAVCGDTTLPSFGMARADYEDVAKTCTRVIHSAGLVRMNLPIADARAAAVGAAENIILFAHAIQQHGHLEKVEFVSTVGVGGHTREVHEDWIETQRTFHNTYEQAKAEAEIRVRAAVNEGLPITVHRPSMVVGDSVSGRTVSFQVFYHLCEFLSGLRSRGVFPPFGQTKLDTVPADYVARAIVWSAGQRQTIGRVLHLCSGPPHAIVISDLQRQVIGEFLAHGIAVPKTTTIPRALFRALLWPLGVSASPRLRRAIKTLPIFLDYLASDQVFRNAATRDMLEPHGVILPAPASYLPKVFDYYLEHRRGSQKRNETSPEHAQ